MFAAYGINADCARKVLPREFYRPFLGEHVRPDGRTFSRGRSVKINQHSITSAEGSALVRFGRTTVVCGIKAEVTRPSDDEPQSGWVVPNVELPALCSPLIRPGPPTEEAQAMTVRLSDLLNQSVLDKSALCIQPGEYVWLLHVHCLCLNADGNVWDAVVLATLAALQSAKLPLVEWTEEHGLVRSSMEAFVPLRLQSKPVSVTYSIFDKENVLLDPCAEEEQIQEGSWSVVLDAEQGAVLDMEKEGPALKEETLLQMIVDAQQRAQELMQLLSAV